MVRNRSQLGVVNRVPILLRGLILFAWTSSSIALFFFFCHFFLQVYMYIYMCVCVYIAVFWCFPRFIACRRWPVGCPLAFSSLMCVWKARWGILAACGVHLNEKIIDNFSWPFLWNMYIHPKSLFLRFPSYGHAIISSSHLGCSRCRAVRVDEPRRPVLSNVCVCWKRVIFHALDRYLVD